MKNAELKLSIIIGSAMLLFCIVAYFLLPREFRWAVSSVIEVPICTARIADKVEIKAKFADLKSYIIQSLELGMSPEEVEKTLSRFGQVYIKNSFIDNEQETNTEILIELCDNPFGNVVLLIYYSKDGHLINVVDPYAE